MALVIFLRGVNVGGHRTFRPTLLAKQLRAYDAVNIGAAGTFVIRKPPSQAQLRADLCRRLPFQSEVMICKGHELLDMASGSPFGDDPIPPHTVRFVSVLGKRPRLAHPTPISLPPKGRWLLRILGVKNKFAFGLYRRHMKVIGYLGTMDKLLGVPATTRNWNTITAIINVLKRDSGGGKAHAQIGKCKLASRLG